jgi:hypothetical protein
MLFQGGGEKHGFTLSRRDFVFGALSDKRTAILPGEKGATISGVQDDGRNGLYGQGELRRVAGKELCEKADLLSF